MLNTLPDDLINLIYRNVFSECLSELQEAAASEPDSSIALHLNYLFRTDERIWVDGEWHYAE